MRLSPRMAAMLAGGTLVLSLGAVTAQLVPQTSRFRDVPQNVFFTESVENLARRGIITGYSDGKFGSYDYITRSQVAAILDRYDRLIVAPLQTELRQVRQQLGMSYCGDGSVQTPEVCDDGNNADGDGCSSECIAEVYCPGGYKLGDTYTASDGCNVCSCTTAGISCTQRFCTQKKCFSSAECQSSEYCSVETGDCQYPCPAGAVCIQACGGVCLPRSGGTSSLPLIPQTCGNGVCDSGEVGLVEQAGPAVYCPQDCPVQAQVTCGNGVCEAGEQDKYSFDCVLQNPGDPCISSLIERGSCPQDCEGGLTTCERLKNYVDTLFDVHHSCETDSDCAVFVQSCSPYQTCGKPVRSDALSQVTLAVDSYTSECPSTPAFCTQCIETHAVCSSGECVLDQ